MLRSAALLLLLLTNEVLSQSGPLTGYPDCKSGPLSKFPICDQSLDQKVRAADLIGRLQTNEKIIRIGESYGLNAIERIGLPPYHWRQNAVHGLGPGVIWNTSNSQSNDQSINQSIDQSNGMWSNATMYPHVISMAASFDRALWNEVGGAIATEARAFANVGRAGLDWFTPNINIYRDPRWGRGQETPGEDPFLTSEFGVQFVKGLQQGEDSRYYKVVGDCKHFAGYDVEHWGGQDRSFYNANISNLDLVESYLPSFEACVKDAQVGSIMCSYNAVNGVPSCANDFFIQTILREHWGFDGWVVSDCGAIEQIYTAHHYTEKPEEAVMVGLLAGVDQDCGPWYAKYGQQAYDEGMIWDALIDKSLMRTTMSLLKMGYFDDPADQPYRKIGPEVVNSEKHQQLSIKAGRNGLVLLKNKDNHLPFNPSVNPSFKQSIKQSLAGLNIALIGPLANDGHALLGNYESPAPFEISVNEALTAFASTNGMKINYFKGCDVNSTSTSGFKDALAAAKAADLIIYVGGIDNSIEAEGLDRFDINLPGQQMPLLAQLSSVAKNPMTLVMVGAGQVDLSTPKSRDDVGSIVWAGYPGQSGGQVIVDLLFGQFSPSGRLVSTQYPASYVKQVPMTDQSFRANNATGNPGRTYRFYSGEPVYAFGDGESYSKFTYQQVPEQFKRVYDVSELVESALISDRLSDIAYNLNITNNGPMKSDATALGFISSQVDYEDVSPPIKQLFDFTHQYEMTVGESRTVWFMVSYRSLVHTDSQGHQWLLPGRYQVTINNNVDFDHEFELVGEPTLVKKWPGGAEPVTPKRVKKDIKVASE